MGSISILFTDSAVRRKISAEVGFEPWAIGSEQECFLCSTPPPNNEELIQVTPSVLLSTCNKVGAYMKSEKVVNPSEEAVCLSKTLKTEKLCI